MSNDRVISGPPPADFPIPEAVREAAGVNELVGVWLNAMGGLTCKIGSGNNIRFAKWSPETPPTAEADLLHEAHRMQWAGQFIIVPKVLSSQ